MLMLFTGVFFLLGESVPVTKTPLPNPKTSKAGVAPLFSIKEHGRHVLFCGTHVIQTRYYGSQKVKAVVIRTGALLTLRELVAGIMLCFHALIVA